MKSTGSDNQPPVYVEIFNIKTIDVNNSVGKLSGKAVCLQITQKKFCT